MATAAATISKTQTEAARLRSEIGTFDKQLVELQSKLGTAQQALAALEGQRLKLAADALDGKVDAKASAEIHHKLDDARLPIEVLQPRVTTKQRELDAARARLAVVEREISIEARRQFLQARLETLEKEGNEAVARIGSTLRGLLEALSAYDKCRDALHLEFHGAESPFSDNAVGLTARFGRELWDGHGTRVEQQMLAEGYKLRGDIRLELKNLWPPK